MKHDPWSALDTPEAVAHMHVHLLGLGYYCTERGKMISNMPPKQAGRMRRLGAALIIEERIDDLMCIRSVYEDPRSDITYAPHPIEE